MTAPPPTACAPDAPNPATDPPSGQGPARAYEIKGLLFSLLAMRLKSVDLVALRRQIESDRTQLSDFLCAPLVLDLQELDESADAPDFPAMLAMMREAGMSPVASCHGPEALQAAARAAGLAQMHASSMPPRRRESAAPLAPAPAQAPPPPRTTHIVAGPVRTGQRVFEAHGDLTLLAGVNPGAEVLAAGSIHVYGPLRGRALAGVHGDAGARIFTRSMEAELVSIAGCFRLFDNLDENIRGKPAQIHLDGERIVVTPIV